MNDNLPLTAIVGASPKPGRYSYLAMKLLKEKALPFVLVNPAYKNIEDEPVYPDLARVPGPVDTVSLYLAPDRQDEVVPQLVALKPRRVIFNPGSESAATQAALEAQGIECLEACTLVLLKTGQFLGPKLEKNTQVGKL